MLSLIFYLFFFTSDVDASGTDVTNNLFSDIGPLLALFGENFARQFLRESFTWLDHVVFAMAPLGIITAIVGAIRVGGPPWLKAVIGRARENRSLAELEFMSSTSHEVCELWNGEGIVRTTGKGIVKQIVYLEGYGDAEKECFLFTLTQAKEKYHMEKRVYRGPLIKHLCHRKKPPSFHVDRPDRAPNISLNLHSHQATWELVATAAAGILLQSGVLVFSGFVAYNSRFGQRVGGPPSSYAYPVLLAGTITLAFGMWLSALVIGNSTEEFEWEIKPKSSTDDDLDKHKRGTSTPDSGSVVETSLRVFWLQKGIFVSDQSFDSFMLMAKGKKKTVLTSCRNNDPLSHDDAQETGKVEGSTDVSTSLNILCIISTFASITGFILQFEGFRGISWACSIAQLVAIIIMTILRAIIRRGMLDSPATEKITPDYEIDWLSHRLGFDREYLNSLSGPTKQSCFNCGLGMCGLFHKSTQSVNRGGSSANSVTSCWKVSYKLNYPTNSKFELVKPEEGRRASSVTVGEPGRPGFAPSNSPFIKQDQSNTKEKYRNIKTQEEMTQQVHAIINIRKRLANLTEWKAPSSEHAARIAKAIGKIMELFDFETVNKFAWSIDVQINTYENTPRQIGNFRLVASKVTSSASSWTTSEEDLEAILSLWMYHLKNQNHENTRLGQTSSTEEKPDPIGLPFRRVLGPATSVLKTDLAWWAGDGVEEALDQFEWKDVDSLSLGYCHQSNQNPKIGGAEPSCWAKITNVSMEQFIAQHIFSAFMWAIANHIPISQITPLTTVDHQSQMKFKPEVPEWTSLKLSNQKISEMAKAVEAAALSTLEDAYLLIIPPLSVANKLPSEGLVEMVRQKATENHKDYQLDKAYELYLQLLIFCDKSLLSNRKFVLKAVATAVDFLITTASATAKDEGTAGDAEAQLKSAKVALIKQLRSKNLEPVSKSLKVLFEKQRRLELYNSLLPSQADENVPKGDAKKSTTKDARLMQLSPERQVLTDFGHTALYKQIIGRNGDINKDNLRDLEVPDILGWTPLHYAVIYAPGMVSEILKNARSLASTPDLAGRIPLHYAVMNQSKDTKGLVRMLLHAHGKADSGSDGILPLHLAAKYGNEEAARLLLESPLHKEKLSSGDYWGMTALHFASIEGRKPIVKLLLDCEARISAQNRFDRTALHLAVAKIDVGVVAELLRKDDANKATKARDKNNKTALQIAAELKRNADEEFAQASSDKQSVEDKLNKPAKTPIQAEEQESRQKLTRQLNEYKNYISTHTSEQNVLKKIIKSLLQKEDLKVSGGKMLLWAAKERLNTTFELLMDEGVEVGEIDVLTGETVLHFAAKVGSSDMVEKLLPRRDPNDARPPATVNESSSVEIVNRPDGTNTTALILGAIGGYSKIVDLLLKAGANPKAVDQNERTALSWAVEKGQVTIVKRLLDEPEMNPNIVDGKPPRLLLARAAENGNLAMAKLLCVKGANVDSKSDSAHTPIFWAVINGHQEIVAYFLRATAKPDVNEIDKFSNYTLLSEAVNAGHLKIVEQLIDAGADVQKQSGSSRETALSYAARLGRKEIVSLLLDKHAKMEIVDRVGWTPLMFAIQSNHLEIVKLLISKGSFDTLSTNGETSALSLAIKANSDEMVSDILKAGGRHAGPHLEIAILWAAKKGSTSIVELLLERGVAVDAKPHGSTSLLMAAKRGHLETVRLLLDHNAEVNFANEKSESSLYWASFNDFKHIVELLLEKRKGQEPANLSLPTTSGSTALLAAVMKGNEDVANVLVKEGADVTVKNDENETPLYWACWHGFTAMAQTFLDKDATPNITTAYKFTPLLAAIRCIDITIVDLLLGKGASFESQDSDGYSALNFASHMGEVEIVRLLLNRKANVKVKDQDGDTPLHQCAICGHLGVAELLILAGADPEAKNNAGRSPLHCAAENGHVKIAKRLLDLNSVSPDEKDGKDRTPLSLASAGGYDDLVFLLLTLGGADLESKDESGRTPIIWAALEGETTTVKLLSRLNANIESQDEDLRTSLSWAASEGNIAVVDVLLENTAEIESRDKSGRTPLSWAAAKSQEYVVKRLLDAKASVLSTDYDGRNPLSWATSLGSGGVVRLLLQQDPVTQIETQDSKGLTALHRAVECGANDPVELILNAEPNLNIKDKNQETPLGLGARKDDESVVLQLLEADANPNVQDHLGRTPLFSAIHSDHDTAALRMLDNELDTEKHPTFSPTPLQAAVFQYSYEVVDKLLTRGADVSGMDIQGRTAIHIAAVEGPVSYLTLLVQKGLDVTNHDDPVLEIYDNFDGQGRHALHHGACSRNIEIVEYLLHKYPRKSQQDQPDNDGWTPLHWAAKAGDKEVVQLFLDAGADPNLKEKLNNWSPLGVAQYHDRHSVVETLIKYFEARKEEMSSGVVLPGRADFSKFCDGCRIGPIYGPVFSCTFCDDFDFCYKCKTSSELTHPDHIFRTEDDGSDKE
ncbi:Ankyrin repeat-containing protein [Glarea lozoyensis ATCC 20868]|uniref:Ankyrin repeat-containing protein n=1 Tax=Glarea lozoyensis (strain ATCC 20868 / MF5171) TaxID=1116229 RepID=S3D899_GLAL2|nr:Ankyrin repeat-containing protein [Glarea lozoyensis ATCC 20868]EPE33339.1 Ankyrin repeat-containing protein [Glarea lozoyensis ATCC 20868]